MNGGSYVSHPAFTGQEIQNITGFTVREIRQVMAKAFVWKIGDLGLNRKWTDVTISTSVMSYWECTSMN